MRIRWTNCPFDPSKNGTHQHVDRAFGVTAIGYEQAVAAPFTSYVDRLNYESSIRTAAAPGDTVVRFYSEPEWSFGFIPYSGVSAIFRKFGTETAIFIDVKSAHAAGAPKPLIEKLRIALEAPEESARAKHAAKLQQQQQDATWGK